MRKMVSNKLNGIAVQCTRMIHNDLYSFIIQANNIGKVGNNFPSKTIVITTKATKTNQKMSE